MVQDSHHRASAAQHWFALRTIVSKTKEKVYSDNPNIKYSCSHPREHVLYKMHCKKKQHTHIKVVDTSSCPESRRKSVKTLASNTRSVRPLLGRQPSPQTAISCLLQTSHEAGRWKTEFTYIISQTSRASCSFASPYFQSRLIKCLLL